MIMAENVGPRRTQSERRAAPLLWVRVHAPVSGHSCNPSSFDYDARVFDERDPTTEFRLHECLELLGCYGSGKADKFAEICAGVVLAGETSLASAVIHGDWVASHDQLGRNRP